MDDKILKHIENYYHYDRNHPDYYDISYEDRIKKYLKIENTTLNNLITSSIKDYLFETAFGIITNLENKHQEWIRNFKKDYFKWISFHKTNIIKFSFCSGIYECEFKDCNFENVLFLNGVTKCTFVDCKFINCKFSELKDCKFENCNNLNCDFNDCIIENCSFFLDTNSNNSYLRSVFKNTKIYGLWEKNNCLNLISMNFENCEFCSFKWNVNICEYVNKIDSCEFKKCILSFKYLTEISNSKLNECDINRISGKYNNFFQLTNTSILSCNIEEMEYIMIINSNIESSKVDKICYSNFNESKLNSSIIKATISDCIFNNSSLIGSTINNVKKTKFTGMSDFSNLILQGDFYPSCSFENVNLSNINAIKKNSKINQINNSGLNILKLNGTINGLPQILYCFENDKYYTKIGFVDKTNNYDLDALSAEIPLLNNTKFEFTFIELIDELENLILSVTKYNNEYLFRDEPENKNYKFDSIKDNIIIKLKFIIEYIRFIELHKTQLKLSTDLKELPFNPLV